MKHFMLVLLLSGVTVSESLSQIVTITNNPVADNRLNRTNPATTTVTFTVTGVQPGMALREVRMQFGNKSTSYSASIEGLSVANLNDGSNTIRLLRDHEMGGAIGNSSSDRRFYNFTLRDHASLQYFNTYNTQMTYGQPFYYGYYRSRDPFTSLKTGTAANTTWTITFVSNSLTTYTRHFTGATLVFGKPLSNASLPVQTATNQSNNSCSSAFCVQSGDVVSGSNISYAQMASNVPLSLSGCMWNTYNNRSAWFKFVASQSTARFSISGFSNDHQSVVLTLGSGSTCASPVYQLVACPTQMDATVSGPQDFKYFMNDGKYSYGTGLRANHGYEITGLTPGKEYFVVVDGVGATLSSSNMSNFYFEMVSGADNIDLGSGLRGGCNRDAPLPISLSYFDGFSESKSNKLRWETASEINNAYFMIEKSKDGENWHYLARLTGAGNSNLAKQYDVADLTPYTDTYYRLIQQDFDGTSIIYNPIIVHRTAVAHFAYPNPAQQIIYIPQELDFSIWNMQGQLILQKNNHDGNIDISGLQAGLYVIRYTNGEVQKIIKE